MVVGIEDSERLEERIKVSSREIDVPEIGKVEIIEILDPEGDCCLHLYRTDATRTLDESFGMDGTPKLKDDEKSFPEYVYLGRCMLGEDFVAQNESDNYTDNIRTQYVLAFFVDKAMRLGYFIGFREDELRSNKLRGPRPAFFRLIQPNRPEKSDLDMPLNVALTYFKGAPEPFIYRQKIEGHTVIFPRNIPEEFVPLPKLPTRISLSFNL